MFPLSSDCSKAISLDASVPRVVGAVLDYCLRGLVAAGRGMLICGLPVWPCPGLLRERVVVASDVNSSLLSQLPRPRGSFWVVRLVPAISGPQSRLVCLSRGHVEQHGTVTETFLELGGCGCAFPTVVRSTLGGWREAFYSPTCRVELRSIMCPAVLSLGWPVLTQLLSSGSSVSRVPTSC